MGYLGINWPEMERQLRQFLPPRAVVSARQELLAYLRGNRDYLLDALPRALPGLKLEAPVEATYLLWMNVAELGVADPAAHFERRGAGLSDGAPFGARPGSHLRLNFGCPRAMLEEAVRRMASGR